MAAALSVSALTPAMAFAAENENAAPGFYNVKTGEVVSAQEFIFKSLKEKSDLLKNADFYFADGQGKVVKASAIITSETDEALENAMFDETKLEADEGVQLTPDGTVEGITLTVKSVTAINTTVDENGVLEFAINGQDKSADLDALKAAGYKVTFKASALKLKADADDSPAKENTTGVVKASAGDTFDYQVVISKDGEEVAKSDRVNVKVEDYATAITEISTVDVQLNGITSTSGKLAVGDSATLVVKGFTKKSPNKEVTITNNVKYSTDKAAIATVNNGNIKLNGAKGDVTITVEAGNLSKSVTLNAGNAARVVSAENSSINKSNLLIGAGKSADVEVTLKDQYGDIVSSVEENSISKEDESSVLSDISIDEIDTETNTYKVTLTAGSTSKKGDVVIKVGGVEVGTVNVTVQEAGDVAEYKVTADKSKLDLNKGLEDSDSATLTFSSLDKDGLVVNDNISIDGTNYITKSSDEKVISVNNGVVTAEGVGTATVTVYKVNGAFEDEVATIDFTVVDSTPSITSVEFNKVEDFEASEDIDVNFAELIKKISAKDSEGNLVEASVAKADSGDLNKLVINDENGNEIGSLLVVTSSDAKFTVNTSTITFKQGEQDFSDTVHVSVLNNSGEIVGSTSFKVNIKKATPAEGGETDTSEGSGADEGSGTGESGL